MTDRFELMPSHLRLERLAEDAIDTLLPHILQVYEAGDDSFSDTAFELENPDIITLCDGLATVLCEGDTTIYIQHCVHRAFFFALLVGNSIAPEATGIFRRHYQKLYDRFDVCERVIENTQIYLADRPSIGRLIGAFIFEIDPYNEGAYYAEITAAMVLQEIETIAEENFYGMHTA